MKDTEIQNQGLYLTIIHALKGRKFQIKLTKNTIGVNTNKL